MRFLGTVRHAAFCMRVEVFGVKQKPENIAAGKVTEQSSTYSNNYTNGASTKAVDGNSDPDFDNGHCSRTLKDSPSWWRVDLGNRVPVFEVRIVNRLVWSSNRSSDLRKRDYKITLGDSLNVRANPECVGRYSFANFVASAVCYMQTRDYGIVYFPTGRYVGIMTTRKQFLQLCEVEIYSRDNMAFNKTAEQSSTDGVNSASRAVDGNINTQSWTGSDNPAWWRVDLGREEHVSAVYIVGSILPSFDIRVGSVPNVLSGPLCVTSLSRYRDVFSRTFLCRPTLYGKYVTIIVMERDNLALYEVEVYSARRGLKFFKL